MSITITITRDSSATGKSRLGSLTTGSFNCKTLENEGKKIPTGQYSASKRMYNKGGYMAIEIQNVPGRSHILIHIGNYHSVLFTFFVGIFVSFFSIFLNFFFLGLYIVGKKKQENKFITLHFFFVIGY